MKLIFKALLKVYKWYCILLGSFYAFGLFLSVLFYQFGTFYFPNGAYLQRKSTFSGDSEIHLWHPDGDPLSISGVKDVCYNKRFVKIWSIDMPDLIYEKDARQAVFSDEPGFYDMTDRSGLSRGMMSCTGRWNRYRTAPYLMFHIMGHGAFPPDNDEQSERPDRKSGAVEP